MTAFARPTIALTATGVIALGSAFAAAPAALLAAPTNTAALSANADTIVLAGFIADIYNSIEPVVADAVSWATDLIGVVPIVGPPIANQIDILYNYGEQAVAGTVYWVDDLVTPLVNGDFWPLSGNPGNYISGAIDSTIDWAGGLANTAVGFVQAEIDYFFGWIPNIPNLINNVINAVENVLNWFNIPNLINGVVNAVENVINWIIGWIPGPLAAVEAPAAAAGTVARTALAPRPAEVSTPAAVTAGAEGEAKDPSPEPTLTAAGVADAAGGADAADAAAAADDAAAPTGRAARTAARAESAGDAAPAASSGRAGKQAAARAESADRGEARAGAAR